MTALRDFVADLMEREGAAVETLEPDGLAVIAPPEEAVPQRSQITGNSAKTDGV